MFVVSCRDNLNTGLLMTKTGGILLQNNVFENNTASSVYNIGENSNLTLLQFRTSGGLTLFFVNSSVEDNTLIRNCTFTGNNASANEENMADIEDRPKLYIPRGHGGAAILSFQNTNTHTVEIRNCSFTGNSAQFSGGAVSIQFYRGSSNTNRVASSSTNNTVVIDSVVFEANTCLEEGGAISVNSYEAANHNTVLVKGSLFWNNSAGTEGGAYKFIIEASVHNVEYYVA